MRLLRFVVPGLLVLAGCGVAEEVPESETGETTAPQTTTLTVAVTSSTSSTSSTVATTVDVSVTAPVISAAQLAAAAAVGDVAAGEALFNSPVEGIDHAISCSSCHTLDGRDGRNPTIVGISQVAGDRIPGMSAVDYLRQSIVDPNAFKADGDFTSAAMPYQYANLLSEEEIDNLIAFLLTT